MNMPAALNPLRSEALRLLAERDVRFYDSNDVIKVLANQTAGERIRRQQNPLLDEEGAEAFATATRRFAIPNMSANELVHLIHCLKFCPKKTTTPAGA